MPVISIQRVNILGNKCYSILNGVKTEITEEEFGHPVGNEVHSKIITFDTPTGELSDGQYAVQENGYVLAKIPKNAVFKMPPQYIDLVNNKITSEGVIYFKTNSVLE